MQRNDSEISIRSALENDAEIFVRLHYEAVHSMAAASYEKSILEAWSSSKIEERISVVRKNIKENPDHAFKLLAEIDGVVVGLGEVVPVLSELRAVYVSPQVARRGVGSALLNRLEEIARENGATELWLDSSLNAEPFYRAHGYKSEGLDVHELRSGQKMDCIKMRKPICQ